MTVCRSMIRKVRCASVAVKPRSSIKRTKDEQSAVLHVPACVDEMSLPRIGEDWTMAFSSRISPQAQAQVRATRPLAARHAPRPALPGEARPQQDLGSADPQGAAAERALREWQRHVDGGRIGACAAPAAGAGELRCASLAAILGASQRGSVW